jgi:soluble lytic murein transglycosylase-like protein
MFNKKIFIFIVFIVYYCSLGKSIQKEIVLTRLNKLKYKLEYLSNNNYDYELINIINDNIEEKHENLILSIILKESEFNQFALSKAYCNGNRDYGLMQISDKWWEFDKDLIYDLEYNINFGYSIFKYFLKISNNNIENALYLYNGSKEYPKEILSIKNKLEKEIKDKYNEL